MWIKIITAVVQMDVRNPFDKLVFQPFGVSFSPANVKQSYLLSNSLILDDFKKINNTGMLTVLVWGEDTDEVHKLQALMLNGKKVHEIELLANQISVKENVNFNIGPIDFGFQLTRFLEDRGPSLFATQKLSDAKLLSVIPVTNPKNNQRLYQVNFDGSGHSRTGTVSNWVGK